VRGPRQHRALLSVRLCEPHELEVQPLRINTEREIVSQYRDSRSEAAPKPQRAAGAPSSTDDESVQTDPQVLEPKPGARPVAAERLEKYVVSTELELR